MSPALSERQDLVARHGHLVVLVEDDAGLRAALERVLAASGFEARSYADAETALADATLLRAECLVVDLTLPSMSGLELVDRLRQLGIPTPIVAITAYDTPRVRREVCGRGVKYFLAKPFLGSTLVRLLDDITGGGSNQIGRSE